MELSPLVRFRPLANSVSLTYLLNTGSTLHSSLLAASYHFNHCSAERKGKYKVYLIKY